MPVKVKFGSNRFAQPVIAMVSKISEVLENLICQLKKKVLIILDLFNKIWDSDYVLKFLIPIGLMRYKLYSCCNFSRQIPLSSTGCQ